LVADLRIGIGAVALLIVIVGFSESERTLGFVAFVISILGTILYLYLLYRLIMWLEPVRNNRTKKHDKL
jgi:hypothetical protein